jgi:hypothetical protein
MAADPTLVRAAFTEASTRYGGDVLDQSKLYQSTKDISAGYGLVISEALNVYNNRKKEKNALIDTQLNAFKKIAETQLQKVYNQGNPLDDKIISAIETRIEELQDEFELVNSTGDEDTKENKRARRKIIAELNRITSNAINLRANMQEFMENAKNIDYDMIYEPELLRYATDVIDLDNYSNRDDIQVGYDDKGIIFTVDGNTMSFDDLQRFFPKANLKVDNAMATIGGETALEAAKDAEIGKTNYDIRRKREELLESIKETEDIPNAIRKLEKTGHTQSFKQALIEDFAISQSVLNNMFYIENGEKINVGGALLTELDIVKDGVINEKDIQAALDSDDYATFEANMDILIDAIVNPNNPAFDLQTTKSLIADYYIGSEDGSIVGLDQQAYNKIYETAEFNIEKRNNPEGKDPNVVLTAGNRNYKKSVVDSKYDNIMAKDTTVEDFYGNMWTPQYGYNNEFKGYTTIITNQQTKLTEEVGPYNEEQLMNSPYFGMRNYLVKYKNYTPPRVETENRFETLAPESFNDIIATSENPAQDIADAINNDEAYKPTDESAKLMVGKDGKSIEIKTPNGTAVYNIEDPNDINLLVEFINSNREIYGDPLFEQKKSK